MPGVYTLSLHNFSTTTRRATHHLTYRLSQGTTIGMLVDKIIDRKMHKFLFLPYTSEGRWKGCGDHAYVAFQFDSNLISTMLTL